MFYGDYHTHTIYSHGKGTIEDNVREAEARGIKELAISDHGLRHIVFGMRRRWMKEVREEIDRLNKIYNVKVLMGIESNIIGNAGWVDVKAEDLKFFDVLLCGYHKFIWPQNIFDTMNFIMYNGLYNMFKFEPSQRTIKLNTNAYIRAIQRYPIDVITHINLGLKVDVVEIAKAARDYGTFIEISGKRLSYSDEQFCAMYDTGVNFVVNSDAHSPSRIGEVAKAQALIKRLNVDPKRIVNSVENEGKFKRRMEYYKKSL